MVEAPSPVRVQPDDRLCRARTRSRAPTPCRRRSMMPLRLATTTSHSSMPRRSLAKMSATLCSSFGGLSRCGRNVMKPASRHGLFDAFDPPPLTLVEQRPGDVAQLGARSLVSSLRRFAAPRYDCPNPMLESRHRRRRGARPCHRSAPGVAVRLAIRPCIGVPSTSTIASRAA